MKDYYATLGVEPDATLEQIKSAYRERVKKLHPDRHGQDRDCGPFLDVQEAYEVLSDPARRRTYDQKRARPRPPDRRRAPEPLRPNRCPVEPLVPGQGTTYLDDVLFDWPVGSAYPSPTDSFEQLWNSLVSLSHPRACRAENIDIQVELSPTQAMRGGRMRVLVPVQVPCPACRGRGGGGPYPCQHCRGRGVVLDDYPVLLRFPAGIRDGYTSRVLLDQRSDCDLYLTVRFRVG